ncbi:expressed unknown protein [Seminavis robusta]|uniref:Uncharacterized protein n=1 Tax=Seminavis robusta TaxID=568900 RepID=A0A9N8H6M3_9STRA|nr:expressed unknown protein [Seminavis robusta]|eukprot:Sro47_g027880.1 n/a (227) ;mRNA; f:91320-92000
MMMKPRSAVAPIIINGSASSISSAGSEPSSVSTREDRLKMDGDRVRNRLLTRLGIFQPQPQQQQRRIAPLRKVAPLTEPLKFHDGDIVDDKKEDSSSVDTGSISDDQASSPASSTRSRKSVVAFDNEVAVVPIPKHQEYSNRIRSRLWSNKKELRTMAARNTLEYQSEGWNPSTVVEDEGFITTSTGERIHPVHLQRLLASPFMMRSPFRVMQHPPPLEVNRRPMR